MPYRADQSAGYSGAGFYQREAFHEKARCKRILRTVITDKDKEGVYIMTTLELQKMANEVRKGIVTAVHSAKAGHPGGSLSAADVFTYLYFEEMNIDPKNPKNPDRDRFVLSKGPYRSGLLFRDGSQRLFPGRGS